MVRKQGETKTRKSAGVPKGGAHFLTWEATRFKKLLRNHKFDGLRNAPIKDPSEWEVMHSDSVVLVDCRPDQNILDVLVAIGTTRESGQTLTISLRDLEIDTALLEMLGARFGGYAYNRYWHNEGD